MKSSILGKITLNYFLYYKKFENHNILLLAIPALLNSLTDIAMEGVQFPINFYIFYGYFFSEGINLKTDKIKL